MNNNLIKKRNVNNDFIYYIQSGNGKKRKISRETYNILKNPNYIMHVSEPWFSLISLGIKTIEGRLNKGKFKAMEVGELIEWTNNDFSSRHILTKIKDKRYYNSFKEYLETEGLEKTLPAIPNIKMGTDVYYKYYNKQDEQKYGIVAIELELIYN